MLEKEKQKGTEAEGAVWAGGWEDGWHVEAAQGAGCDRTRGLHPAELSFKRWGSKAQIDFRVCKPTGKPRITFTSNEYNDLTIYRFCWKK